MTDANNNNDELMFAEERPAQGVPEGRPQAWRVFIVDDDADVHAATTLALRGVLVLNQPLEFLHAHSAAQAREILAHEKDIAVVLLDVVMEQEDAGLRLVRDIRERFHLHEARIILRTGQPGYAPETDAIRDYDINDYKTKSELTRNKLYTTLTAAIRSYDQLRTINASRRGLALVVQATSELMAVSGMRDFAAGVITQLAALLGVRAEGLICAERPLEREAPGQTTIVIAAAGRYSRLINQPLEQIDDARIRSLLEESLTRGEHIFAEEATVLYFGSREQRNLAAYLDTRVTLDEDTRALLGLFCANIAIGLDNTVLFSRLHDMAYFDSLSGLPNRHSLAARLDQLLGSPQRAGHTLVLADIDHFAETNDALGQHFGDLLLKGVARRLTDTFGAHCEVARISADIFALLGSAEHLLPARLSAALKQSFHVGDHELMISMTMGIVHLADVDGDGDAALRDASIALRRAKLGNRGEYSFYTREMATEMGERARLLQALRHAVDADRLFLMYQPQVDIPSGRIIGVEALLRWRTEEGYLIPPERFIPIAEHSGLIVRIGEWVLRMACFQQADLTRRGFGELRMGINVSVPQLRHPEFLLTLDRALADSGAKPDLIELEITESMAMDDPDRLSRILEAARARGVRIAVDDFGTGFSSLSTLHNLKVDRLKIDRGFVNDIQDERTRRIPELVIQLGQTLNLDVIAEGVETPQQADILRALGCSDAQGFYYARPMEPASLFEWLAVRQNGPAGRR